MIKINDIKIEDRIATNYFKCDLNKCKGACCTFPGDKGAPLLNEEIDKIKSIYPIVKEYLSKKSRDYIESFGMYEGKEDNYTTMCIDFEDCVFVYYQNDIALCAIEKAYIDKKIDFQKPISCHLFPIRVSKYNGTYLYYEKIPQCNPAINHGFDTNTKIYTSVKDALIRAYGIDWYNKYTNSLNKEENQ